MSCVYGMRVTVKSDLDGRESHPSHPGLQSQFKFQNFITAVVGDCESIVWQKALHCLVYITGTVIFTSVLLV